MNNIFALLIFLIGLSFAQVDTTPAARDNTNPKGGKERPVIDFSSNIKPHYIENGAKVYAMVWIVHPDNKKDTVFTSDIIVNAGKFVYKKTTPSDTGYTTNVRNVMINIGEVLDGNNAHR
jgi:hypothetical protein